MSDGIKYCQDCIHYKRKSCPKKGILYRTGEDPNFQECFKQAPDGLSDVPTVEEEQKTEARNLRGMSDDPKARMIVEKEELEIRIQKLQQFLASGQAQDVLKSYEMHRVLHEQLFYMKEYSNILSYRLTIWDKTDEEIEETG